MNKTIRRIAMITLLAPGLAVCAAAHRASAPIGAQPAESPIPPTAQTITIHAKKFEFIPAEITLKKGETVKLELTSDDVHHSLLVKGLGINGDMKKGKITEVTITPEETGDFKGECGVFCGMGHKKMRFIVHVVNP